MAKLTHEDILAYLEEATILELNDLVKAIEEKFDVTAAAPVAVAAADDAGAAAEPTEVNVTLTEVGGTKVAVIKAVREITGLGLVDAKGLVDKVPSVIKEKVSADEAKEIKEKLGSASSGYPVPNKSSEKSDVVFGITSLWDSSSKKFPQAPKVSIPVIAPKINILFFIITNNLSVQLKIKSQRPRKGSTSGPSCRLRITSFPRFVKSNKKWIRKRGIHRSPSDPNLIYPSVR